VLERLQAQINALQLLVVEQQQLLRSKRGGTQGMAVGSCMARGAALA
jgi:hypothetical protein